MFDLIKITTLQIIFHSPLSFEEGNEDTYMWYFQDKFIIIFKQL